MPSDVSSDVEAPASYLIQPVSAIDAPAPVATAGRAEGPATLPEGWPRRFGRVVRRHWIFSSLLVVAAVLRLITILAYSPVLWFNDAFEYVGVARHTVPYPVRPDGYSFVLKLLEPFHSFVLIAVLQHAAGLALGFVSYRLGRRLGLSALLASLASAPILLDAYEIELEHMPLSDTLFTVLLVAATSMALRSAPLGWLRSAGIGALLAAALLVRPAGLPIVIVLAVVLMIRRVGWRAMAAFAAAFMVPVAAYAFWYHAHNGVYAFDNSTGIQLYGRVAGFADCARMDPPARLTPLCPVPAGTHATAPRWIWYGDTPLRKAPGALFSPQKEKLAQEFAVDAIIAQPGDYADAIFRDTQRLFAWHRGNYPNAYTVNGYAFSLKPWPIGAGSIFSLGNTRHNLEAYGGGDPTTKVSRGWATFLRSYQHIVYVRGTLLGLLYLLALAGVVWPWRRSPAGRLPILALLLVSLALTFVPILTVQLDYRYVAPTLAFLPLAAALAAARIRRGLRPA